MNKLKTGDRVYVELRNGRPECGRFVGVVDGFGEGKVAILLDGWQTAVIFAADRVQKEETT